ncbi:hypothetical protein [Devosia sp.]|uniref:PepSY domain-containing protein n=1 Tax=Devosia sp. TaxID=1871048 RepID=UPI0032656FEA
MKQIHPKVMALKALAVALVFALAGTSAFADCLDKRQIQDAVSSGQIQSLDSVLSSAGIDQSQEILSVQVCDEGGQLVYIIGVLSPDGQAQNLTLNAQ